MKTFAFDIQRFNVVDDTKTALNAFNRLHDIITQLELEKRAEEWLLKGSAVLTEWANDNVSPALKFVATFFKDRINDDKVVESLNIVAWVIEIFDKSHEIREELSKDNPSKTEVASRIGLIVSAIARVAKSVDKLKTDGKNSFALSVAWAGIGLVANIISGLDGVDEDEKEEINASCVLFLRELGKGFTKEIFSASIEAELDKLVLEEVIKNPGMLNKIIRLDEWSEAITKSGGLLDLIFSYITGLTNGITFGKEVLNKYIEDGIPWDIAKHDAFIDAYGKFLHETATTFTFGFDDVIFKGVQTFVAWLTKTEVYDPDKNYVEVICDRFKTLSPIYRSVGKKSDDSLLVAFIDNDFCYADDGNDYIGIMAANDTIWAGHGNDTVDSLREQHEGYSLPVKNSIFGGPGDDTFRLHDKSSTIYGGSGKDKIAIFGTDNKIFGDDDNDVIVFLEGANSNTAAGGQGNDIIALHGNAENIVIYYEDGDGKDTIEGFDENDELQIKGDYWTFTRDNDVIVMVGIENYLLLSQAAGKEIKINSNVNTEIQSGSATEIPYVVDSTNFQDYLQGMKQFSGIRGTDGDDKIDNKKDNSIINALGGDDTVSNSGNSVTIHGGDGNDYIENGDENDPSNAPTHGLKVTINGGDGNDSIINWSDSIKINGDIGNDYIDNSGSKVTVNGGDGNDSIENWFYFVTINGGDGSDYIDNSGARTLINSGNGNDYIKNYVGGVTINAGDGNDTITNRNYSVGITITDGKGNDSIGLGSTSKYSLIRYTSGDGDDTVSGFNGDDTLSIAGGTYSTQESGNDVLVVVGDGSILLKNMKGQQLNISCTYTPADTTPADTTPADTTPADTTPADTTPADTTPASTTLTVTNSTSSPVTIDSAIEVVDASTRTKAVKITGNALDNTLTGGSGNDTLDGNSGDDLLTGGSGNDVFIFGEGNDTVTDYGNGNDKVSLTAAAKSFGYVGNDFVFDFADGSLTLTDAASKKISVVGSVTKIFTTEGIYNAAGTAVTLSALTETFTADSKIVTINAASTSNATITGNSKANKVSLGNGDVFVWTGGNDTLSNFAANDLLSVTGAVTDASTSGGNSYVKVGTNKITVKDSSQVTFTDTNGTRIFDGGVFFDEDKTSATLATSTKNFNASSTNVTSIIGNAKANKLTSNATGTTLTGGKGNDTFVTAGGDDFISDYGTGSDKVSLGSSIENFTVTGSDVSLDLSDGSLTIAGGAGKKISLVSGGKTTANIFTNDGIFNAAGTAVTLNASTETFTADSKVVSIDASSTSGATITGNSKANKVSLGNANVFIWTGGNDTLSNFAANDLISVTGAVTDGSVKSGNSYVKVGTNKITVKDSSQVTFSDTNGTRIFDGGIFFDADETSATLGSAVMNYTATDVTSITGNAKANKLYAGDSSTTLTGGKGNDSLWGGSGSDTFIYSKGDGTDKIFGFGEDDVLQILNADGSTGSFTKSTFANNGLTLNVAGGGKIIFDGVTSASTFNINGDTYRVDGKSIVK